MAKYKQAQCIALHIRPGKRDNLVYMGDAAADTDIQNRCAIMRAAIAQAYQLVKRLTPKPQLPSLAVTRQPTAGQVGRQAARSFFEGETNEHAAVAATTPTPGANDGA